MLIFRSHIKRIQGFSYYMSTTKPKREKTYYQILEVPTSATPTTIKKNYLKLAKLYHPDVYRGADKNRFQKIQEAYKVLSNQAERNRYDQKVGLKGTWNQPQSDNDQQSATSGSTNQYGKPQNQFKYARPKAELNLDDEYEKFFSKKSKTQFQEIRLHQNEEFKAMSHDERVRRRFAQVYPDLNLDLKMKYSKSYNEILEDQVRQKNTYQSDTAKKKKEHEQKFNPEGIELRKKWALRGGVVIFLAMLPFILSFKAKMRAQREARAAYEEKVSKLFKNMQQSEIRERLVFK